jgi:hypothetical protein
MNGKTDRQKVEPSCKDIRQGKGDRTWTDTHGHLQSLCGHLGQFTFLQGVWAPAEVGGQDTFIQRQGTRNPFSAEFFFFFFCCTGI